MTLLAVVAIVAPNYATPAPFTTGGGYHRTGAPIGKPAGSEEGGRAVVYFDMIYHRQWAGRLVNLRVAGQTMVEGIPAGPRSIRLYRRSDGALIKTINSGADGNYVITGVADGEYQVVAVDDDPGVVYNDVIAGRIHPVP